MRLRRIAIGLAAFVVVFGVLAVVLRWWVKQRVGPPPLPIVVVLPEVPADNGYDVFVSAAELYVDTGVDTSTQPGAPVTAEQRDALAENEPALAELRRGLEKQCVVPPRSPISSPPHLSTFREFARLLVLESRIATEEARATDAVLPLLDGLRFGGKLEVGANVVDRFIAQAIQTITLRELRRLAGSQQLAQPELVPILQVLSDIQAKAPSIEQTIAIECRSAAAAAPTAMPGGRGRMFFRPEKIAAALREERDAGLRLSRKSYTEVKDATISRPRSIVPSPSRALAAILSPVYEKVIRKDFQMRSRRRGTQVLIAVELYRLRNGSLPRSLADLESLDIPGVKLSIIDPLTEKPYIYRVQNGDYFLYSIGMDLKDDGGRKDSINADKPGDLLFHTPSK